MKLSKPNKKWFLAVIGLLLALFILKFVLFLTAKPKITVDYVAEYNRTSLPQNYAPEENAAPHYQKAFDVFIEPTYEIQRIYCFLNLHFLSFRSSWSTDLADTEKVLLEEWLNSNTLAFEYFEEASNKSYYWIERKSKDNSIIGITFPELGSFRELSRALIWDAKFKVMPTSPRQGGKEEFHPAFKNILACYKAGKHKCRPNLLVSEQRSGLGIKRNALMDTFIILDKTKVPSEDLKFLQDSLQQEIDNDTYTPNWETEKYFLYDDVQKFFVYNDKGTGRLAWNNVINNFHDPNIWLYNWLERLIAKRLSLITGLAVCLMGPTRNEVVKQIDELFALCELLKTKTPWEIHNYDNDYFKKIKTLSKKNLWFGLNPEKLFYYYHETKAQTQALITVLAILRFKNDHNRLPENLEELVSEGYIQSLPMDPYSDGSLVYKITEDNFILYSIGKDFIDNGGLRRPGGSMAFAKGITHDIIYWPIESLDKTQYKEIMRRSFERTREFGHSPINQE